MSKFRINNQQNMDFTFIANSFIDLFLADANESQIKIYLYLLRYVNRPEQCSISAMADCFNYSEKDVLRALSYWEKKKVLCLTFDSAKELTGLTLCPFSKTAAQSSQPPRQTITPPEEPHVKTAAYISNNQTYRKPEYTLDQLAEFQSRESTAELMFIAESYLGKTLSANDVRSILFISDELHFSFDLIDYLLQYCIDRGKRDFRYIEKVAIS